MYYTFYGLQESPFDTTPDSKFLFWSQNHQTAFRHLLYSVQSRKGLVLLTGEVGTGKTTLLNTLINFFNQPEEKTKIVYIVNSKFSTDDIFIYIFNELNLKNVSNKKGEYWIQLKEFLSECNKKGEKVLLILDESQNYELDVLEEVRLLLNLETSEGKLLQIILAGQPQLMNNIKKPELYQLKQRIGLSYNLQPLNREETKLYIQKRLEIAGAKDSSLFHSDAIGTVYNYSRGIPRIINILCDNALLFGYAMHRRQISTSIIEEVTKNMDLEKSDESNPQQPESMSSGQSDSEEIDSGRVDRADDIIVKYAQRYSRRGSSQESINHENLNGREFYREKSNRERKIRKRFAWLVQVTLISIIVFIIVLLAKENLFIGAKNFIQTLFYDIISPRNNPGHATASKSELNVSTKQPPQSQDVERQTDVSAEWMVAVPPQQPIVIPATTSIIGSATPNEQSHRAELPKHPNNKALDTSDVYSKSPKVTDPVIEAPVTLGETNSQVQPAPTTRLDPEDSTFIVVRTSDTFKGILLKRYGAYNRVIIERVLDANPAIQDINAIFIGQRIVLPNLQPD